MNKILGIYKRVGRNEHELIAQIHADDETICLSIANASKYSGAEFSWNWIKI